MNVDPIQMLLELYEADDRKWFDDRDTAYKKCRPVYGWEGVYVGLGSSRWPSE